MPQFSGFVALRKRKACCPDTPFIFVSDAQQGDRCRNAQARDNRLRFHDQASPTSCNIRSRDQGAEERKKRKAQESAIARLSRMYADQARELEQINVQHLTLRKLSRYLKGRRDAGRDFTCGIVPGTIVRARAAMVNLGRRHAGLEITAQLAQSEVLNVDLLSSRA